MNPQRSAYLCLLSEGLKVCTTTPNSTGNLGASSVLGALDDTDKMVPHSHLAASIIVAFQTELHTEQEELAQQTVSLTSALQRDWTSVQLDVSIWGNLNHFFRGSFPSLSVLY